MRSEEIRERAGIRYLVFANLQDERLTHGFTLRTGGASLAPYNSLNLGLHVGDDPQAVLKNRHLLAAALQYEEQKVTVGQQVHGTMIREVSEQNTGCGHATLIDALPDTDGLICSQPDIVLMAHAADCTLLFFYDPQRCCIGLAHAGWRGAVCGMGPRMVDAMLKQGCSVDHLRVALAPSIGPCCYKVGESVIHKVENHLRSSVLKEVMGDTYFDLPKYQALQLQEAGIRSEHLTKSAYCTNCHPDLFYSYRAAGGHTGRMAGVISMKW